jgi:glutamyl-tRNA reductase
MYFYLIGVDYNSLAIDTREKFYHARKAISGFWAGRIPYEATILVTCNRIEIYGLAGCADDALGHIAAFSRDFPDFSKYACLKFGEAQVFRHALRLASGLESQINGEPQILSQLNSWKITGGLPFPLKALWDEAISLSEKIRSASGLDRAAGNIAALIYGDIAERMRSKEIREIVIMGTGKIAELFAEQRPPKAHLTFVAHKNYKKAETLAESSGGEALPLQDLPHIITKADAVISVTSSPHYILKKEHFNDYSVRREHSLHVYDLAIPRDAEPEIAAIDGVLLQNLDDLGRIFSRYNESMRERVELALRLIEDVLNVGLEVTL